MSRITVRPRAGLAVPLPDGSGLLPAEGLAVDHTLYWQRRIDDGDVEIPPAAAGARRNTGPGADA